MRPFLLRALTPSLALLWAAGPVRAQETSPFAVLPGGVADRAGKVGYVRAPAGGVDALDLASGKTLWQVAEFCKPLALAGDRLACEAPEKGKANAVRLLVLDTKDRGKLLRRSDPIEFPAWVSVRTAHGRSYTASADLDGNGNLLLHWQASSWYVGGARPTPEMEQRASKHAAGITRIDLTTGRVSTADAKQAKVSPLELPKELQGVKPAYLSTREVGGILGYTKHPIRVGKKAVVLLRSHTGGRDKLELVAWDPATGKVEPKAKLMEGKWLRPQLSRDRRYVLIRQAVPNEQLPPSAFAWSIFDLETGKYVAKVPLENGAEDLAVIGPRVYYPVRTRGERVRPEWGDQWSHEICTLKAIESATGRQLWQHRIWTPPTLIPGK